MLPAILLGALGVGTGIAFWEKSKNPSWTPFSTLFSTPAHLRDALARVRFTSVPTPTPTSALDPGMSTEQVHHVNSVLTTETDPAKIHDHADAAGKLGFANTSKALTAKAEAVGQAKAAGATDADVHKEQLAAGAAAAGGGAAAPLPVTPMSVCEAEVLLNLLARRRGQTNIAGIAIPLPITNAVSSELIHCVQAFQTEAGLPPTGNLDEPTAAALRAAVSVGTAASPTTVTGFDIRDVFRGGRGEREERRGRGREFGREHERGRDPFAHYGAHEHGRDPFAHYAPHEHGRDPFAHYASHDALPGPAIDEDLGAGAALDEQPLDVPPLPPVHPHHHHRERHPFFHRPAGRHEEELLARRERADETAVSGFHGFGFGRRGWERPVLEVDPFAQVVDQDLAVPPIDVAIPGGAIRPEWLGGFRRGWRR
jgi:hypothetical protein